MTQQVILRKTDQYQLVHSTSLSQNAKTAELINCIFEIPPSESDIIEIWYTRNGYFGDTAKLDISYPLASFRGRFYSKVLFTADTSIVSMMNSQNRSANFVVTINGAIATNYYLTFAVY